MNTIIEMNHVTKAYRRKIKSGKGIFKSSKFETKEAIKAVSYTHLTLPTIYSV